MSKIFEKGGWVWGAEGRVYSDILSWFFSQWEGRERREGEGWGKKGVGKEQGE